MAQFNELKRTTQNQLFLTGFPASLPIQILRHFPIFLPSRNFSLPHSCSLTLRVPYSATPSNMPPLIYSSFLLFF